MSTELMIQEEVPQEHGYSHSGTASQDRCLLARRQLCFGWADLSLRQSAAQRAAHSRACRAIGGLPLGTTPGQNFIYVHLNRAIKKYDLNMFYIAGPGHGGSAIVGNVYLEGTWSEVYPNVGQDEAGLKLLFKQFSFPGGISSHVAPKTPGSIHEGGELGYSLSHAFGAAFDNPDLIVACVIGDGEAETGSLATAWQSNKFLDPITDGAVLPPPRLQLHRRSGFSRPKRGPELLLPRKLGGRRLERPRRRLRRGYIFASPAEHLGFHTP